MRDKKTALAALALIASAQGSHTLAHAQIDLQTLELLREESLPLSDFQASYSERKGRGQRAIGGNSYSRQSITNSSYSRQGITNSSYSRQGITNSSYSRQSITNSSYSRQGITRGSYSRQSITGGRHDEFEISGKLPGPVITFEEET